MLLLGDLLSLPIGLDDASGGNSEKQTTSTSNLVEDTSSASSIEESLEDPIGFLHDCRASDEYIRSIYNRKGFSKLVPFLEKRFCEIIKNHDRRRIRSLEFIPEPYREKTIKFLVSHSISRKSAIYLCSLPISEISRIEVAFGAIETSIILSEPEVIHNRGPLSNLRKWFLGNCRSIGLERTCMIYKKWMSWVWVQCSRLVTMEPAVLPPNGWKVVDGKMGLTNIKWLDTCIKHGCLSKAMATRLSIFATATRGFPTPSKSIQEESLSKFRENLCAPDVILSEERSSYLASLAHQLGADCRFYDKKSWRNNAHISLTNSGSYECSRSEGGRAAAAGVSYRSWANRLPFKDETRKGLLGYYQVRAGLELWKTVHVPEEQIRFRIYAKFGNIRTGGIVSDVYHGYDEYTGNQLIECAADYLVEHGYLDRESWSVLKPPPIGVSVVGEPGLKARIVTQDVWAWTIVLQPLGHVAGDMLSKHPFASAGMKRAHQHFEWAKGFTHPDAESESIDFDQLVLLTSDMSEATDRASHSVSKLLLESFLRGAGLDTSFMITSSRLLCSPVTMDTGVISSRGVLMGRPGTKVVLMLHNLVAEYEAYHCYRGNPSSLSILRPNRSDRPWWRNFSAAGDDHITLGPEKYVQDISKAHIEKGLSLSVEKHGYSRGPQPRIGKFCEKLVYGSNKTIWQWRGNKAEYSTTPFVDAVKVRLLSPATKNSDAREVTNPWPGKAAALNQEVEWLRETGGFESVVLLSQMIMKVRFYRFMPRSRIYCLPREVGGLGLGLNGQNYLDILEDLTPNHRAAIQAFANGECDEFTLQVLKSFSSDRYARGLSVRIDKLELVEAIANTTETFSFQEAWEKMVSEGNNPETIHAMRFLDKKNLLESHGFAELHRVIDAAMRADILHRLIRGEEEVDRGFRQEAEWSERIKMLESQLFVSERNRIRLDSGDLQILSKRLSTLSFKDQREANMLSLWISTQISGGFNRLADRGDNLFKAKNRPIRDSITSGGQLLIRNVKLLPRLNIFRQKAEISKPSLIREESDYDETILDTVGTSIRRTWRVSSKLLKGGVKPGILAYRERGHRSNRFDLEDPTIQEHWKEFERVVHVENDVLTDEDYPSVRYSGAKLLASLGVGTQFPTDDY